MASSSLFSRTAHKILFGILFAFSVLGFAGQAKADADISSCGWYLGGPATYTLTQSIGTQGQPCLHIVTPGVIITDGGNNFSINGDINADASFSGTDGNSFTVAGNTSILGNISTQSNGGSVGTVTFTDNSTNHGSISGSAEFDSSSFNVGSVSDTSTYNGFTGWNADLSMYFVGGGQTGLDSNGTGYNSNDGYYYINGNQTGLDSNGNGTWNGIPYQNGQASFSGKIWTNASNDGVWNNPNNWIGGVPVDGDNVILNASLTLTKNITNPVYVIKDGVVIDGGGTATITGDVTSAGGVDGYTDGDNGTNGTKGIDINLQNITVTGSVTSGRGGDGGFGNQDGGSGGDSGSVNITNSTTGSVTSGRGGGGAGYNNGSGGSSGSITITDSTTGSVTSGNGGGGGGGDVFGGGGGSSGSITITNSATTGSITTGGGGGGGEGSSNGGSGASSGSITITGTNLDLSNKTLTVGTAGAGGFSYGTYGSNGSIGSLTLSYSGTLTATNTILSALSNITIIENGTTHNYGEFVGGVFILPGDSISSASQCSSLFIAGTYKLAGDLPSGDCNINNYGITLDGTNPAGGQFTIHGNVVGANGVGQILDSNNSEISPAQKGVDVTLQNIIVIGNVQAGNGGAVDECGAGCGYGYGDSGSGGSVTVTNSITGGVFSGSGGGGDIYSGTGGSGGSITITNSTTTAVVAGGNGGSYQGDGGKGGSIEITNSTTTSVTTSGCGWGYNTDAGSITITNSNTGSVTAGRGGDYGESGDGSSGGSITISNSTSTSVTAGDGGNGGSSGGSNGGNGGKGGSVKISGTNLNLSNEIISSGIGGSVDANGECSNGADGSVTFTYTALTTNDSTNVFTHAANLNINNTSYGPWNGVFNPKIFYFSDQQGNLGRSGDWGDEKNWWTNSSFTTPANSIPAGFNNVILNNSHITQDTTGIASANTLTLNGTSTIAISVTLTNGGSFNGSSSNATTTPTTTIVPTVISITVNGGYGDFYSYGYGSIFDPFGGSFDYHVIMSSDSIGAAADIANYINGRYAPNVATATGNVVTLTGAGTTWTTDNTALLDIQIISEGSHYSDGVGTITSNGPLTFNASSSNNSLIITTATTTFNGDEASSTGMIVNCSSVNTFCSTPNTSGHYWFSITSSADGTKLAAVDGLSGYIYTSTDSGVHWTAQTNAGRHAWWSITSSADGSKLAAVDYGGSIWTNASGTWQAVSGTSGHYWYSITSSADGSKLAAVDNYGSIWTNSGTNGEWVAAPNTSRHYWRSITSSADGSKLAAVEEAGFIWTNSGTNGEWVAHSIPTGYLTSITSSADGSKLAAVGPGGSPIWTNSGTNGEWVAVPGTSGHSWLSITSSADGSRLVAGGYDGLWRYSTHSEDLVSTPITRIFTSAASTTRNFLIEAGHNNWVVVAQGAVVDISQAVYSTATNIFKAIIDPITKLAGSFFWGNNSGGQVVPQITISNTTLAYTGDASTKTLKWNPHVNWDTASTCIYSYNSDFSNLIATTCSSNDTSLPRPTGQNANVSTTIYLRGTDSRGNVSETSLRFFYDNTSPVWTSCGSDLLDEDRTYYLAGDVTGTCDIRNSTGTTTLQGASSSKSVGFKVTGGVQGNGHNIKLQNIAVTDTITSLGAYITILNATTSNIVANGAGNGGNAGYITVATSTTGVITANGANGTSNGGNGGTIFVTNSIGVNGTSTGITANGGNSTSCGNGGSAGYITLKDSSYGTLTNNAGSGSSSGCSSQSHTSGTTHSPVVDGVHYTIAEANAAAAARAAAEAAEAARLAAANAKSSSASSIRTQAPGLPPIFTVLPPVTKLTPIKLTPVPTFGDTTSKNSFSLGEGISNFLFAPISQTFTQILGKELNKYLTQAGFSKEQDIVTIKNKPLLLPKATTTIPGLFTITAKSLPIKLLNQDFTTENIVPVSTYLTSDKTTLQQKVTTTSNTQITITLKGGKTATFNGQTLTFKNNTLTLTTPSIPGTYTLTTSASPLPLVIEVPSGKAKTTSNTTTPTEAPKESWFTKLLNFFNF